MIALSSESWSSRRPVQSLSVRAKVRDRNAISLVSVNTALSRHTSAFRESLVKEIDSITQATAHFVQAEQHFASNLVGSRCL